MAEPVPEPARAAGVSGHPSIARATISGVAWLMFQSLTTRGATFVSQIVLAWLLTPDDFGLIGLAYTVTILVNTLVNFGLDDLLLQRQRTIRLWTSAAVWVSLALGLMGMAILLVAAPIAQRIYGVAHLAGLIAILALALPIGTLATMPSVTLRATLNFRFLATWGTFDLVATQVLTILLAWLGFGAYSFAIPAPLMAALRVVVFWRKAPTRIARRVRPKQVRYLIGNGAVVFGSRIITDMVGQGGYIILGLMASPAAVGVYYFAFRLSAQPVRMLAGNFQNVIFPALVQMNDDPRRQNQAAMNATLILAYLVMPLCFLQAAVADPLIHLLFGNKWVEAIPMVQALSIGLPFDAMSWIAGALLHARGEFRRSFVYSAIAAPISFGFAAYGAWQGAATGVAIAVSVFYMTIPAIYTWRIFLGYGVGLRPMLRIYVAPTLIAAMTIGGATLVSLARPLTDAPTARLAVIGTVGSLAYVAAIYLLDRAVFDQILDRLGLRRLWRRLVPA